MKKFLNSVFVFVLCVSMLAGCASGTSSEVSSEAKETSSTAGEEKVITMAYWEPDLPEWREKVYEDTGIKIEYEVIGSDDYINVINTRLMSGEAPDIMFSRNDDLYASRAANGDYVELTQYKDEWMSNLNSTVIDLLDLDDGSIWGVTETSNYAEVIWYNKDLFDELNLEVPTNYTELLDVSAKLKEAGVYPFAQGLAELWNCRWTPMEPATVLNIEGSEWALGLATGESKYTDDVFKEHFQKMIDYCAEYLHPDSLGLSVADAWDLFARGEVAMINGGSYLGDQYWVNNKPDFECAVMVAPFNDEGVPQVHIMGAKASAMCINSKSENIDVCLEYLQYYCEHINDYAMISGRMVPIKDSGVEWSEFAYMFDHLSTVPINATCREPSTISNDWYAAVQRALLGEDPDQILNDLQTKMDAVVESSGT